jgi:ribonuclease BN (tRNA processing enzyme)
MKSLGVDTARLDLVLLSHLHGDHVAGLPFLLHDYQHATARRSPLLVAGPRGVRRKVEAIYRALFPSSGLRPRRFRVDYRVLKAGLPFRPPAARNARIVPFHVLHGASRSSFGYILEVLGRRLVYSGDTGWFEGLARAARGADLFLGECTCRTGSSAWPSWRPTARSLRPGGFS